MIEISLKQKNLHEASGSARAGPPRKPVKPHRMIRRKKINSTAGDLTKGAHSVKNSPSQKNSRVVTNLAISFLVFATMVFANANFAAAATLGGTSANATIHNVVEVSYKYSAAMTTLKTYATVDVTVLTVPTQATWYPSTSQTVTGGTVATYTTTILRSNANGPDAYTLTHSNGTATDADTQSAQAITSTTPLWLWGGITTQDATTNTLYFPGQSVKAGTNPLLVGNTVEITVGATTHRYQIATITEGTKNTQSAGTTSNETYDVVTLTPLGTSPDVGPGGAEFAVPAGTQVGQYAAIDFNLTTGYPTSVTNDGKNVTNLSAQGAARTAGNTLAAAATTSVDTIIKKGAALAITKTARVLAAGTAPIGDGNLVPGDYSATPSNVKTTQIIEYHISVQNPASNSAAQSVIITDPTPAYTTAVADSQSAGVDDIGAPSVAVTKETVANKRVWESSPRDFGTLAPGKELHIVYQVTVN